MDLSLPGINDDMDADIDWSDAGFYGFLESLSNQSAPADQVRHISVTSPKILPVERFRTLHAATGLRS